MQKTAPSVREGAIDEENEGGEVADFGLTVTAEIVGSPQPRPMFAVEGRKAQCLVVQAGDANTGKIFVGGLTGSGRPLAKGESVSLDAPKGLKLNTVGWRGDTSGDVANVWLVYE